MVIKHGPEICVSSEPPFFSCLNGFPTHIQVYLSPFADTATWRCPKMGATPPFQKHPISWGIFHEINPSLRGVPRMTMETPSLHGTDRSHGRTGGDHVGGNALQRLELMWNPGWNPLWHCDHLFIGMAKSVTICLFIVCSPFWWDRFRFPLLV